MTGSQNSNTHGEQNMGLWGRFGWVKKHRDLTMFLLRLPNHFGIMF